MPEPIILYDGYCPMCNGFVKFILRFDKKQQFYFTPLDSPAGQKILQTAQLNAASSSVVLWKKDRAYTRSEAVFEVAKLLGAPWNFISLAAHLPLKFTNAVYNFIAKYRTKFTGNYTSCPLPPEKWRKRFI